MIPKIYRNKPLVHFWEYKCAAGEVLGVVGRYQVEGEKKDVVPFFKKRGADWLPGIDTDPRPLFGLDRLTNQPKNKAVFFVEGEKCAAALQSIGLCAVTTLGGSMAPNKTDFSPLNGFVSVFILPDNDEPGEKYAATIADILANLEQSPKVKAVSLPGLDEGGDVVDWLKA
ncbi:MAG: toprim domain-containing protein, partial [Methylomonas lenta]|nr:toprim domain-containing protein [Methylomonas lenta]